MIDITTIKEGDTVVFRNGGKSVVTTDNLGKERVLGISFHYSNFPNTGHHFSIRDLDIMEVIKKPEPVVEVLYLTRWVNGGGFWVLVKAPETKVEKSIYKITLTNGEPSIGRV